MNPSAVLLDTHVLIWILTEDRDLKNVPWVHHQFLWIVSPLSLLETKFLLEKRKIAVELAGVLQDLKVDSRFRVDDVPLEDLCLAAMDLSWTRDPFDRLLVAHSIARKIPFGTADRNIRRHYSNVV